MPGARCGPCRGPVSDGGNRTGVSQPASNAIVAIVGFYSAELAQAEARERNLRLMIDQLQLQLKACHALEPLNAVDPVEPAPNPSRPG